VVTKFNWYTGHQGEHHRQLHSLFCCGRTIDHLSSAFDLLRPSLTTRGPRCLRRYR